MIHIEDLVARVHSIRHRQRIAQAPGDYLSMRITNESAQPGFKIA